MKRIIALLLSTLMIVGLMAGCGGGTPVEDGAMSGAVTVLSREEGSGTRGAFVELMGVETDEGDMTTLDAEIVNSTSLVQSTVAGNRQAIGYISLGAYDASAVKAVKVDGVEASVDTVKAGEYAVSRPFVICYMEENRSELGRDFVSFILSADGQAILADSGYIPAADDAEAYVASGLTGSLSLNGSTSVGPVMEKLAERYMEINAGATIDIQQTGSGTGITAAMDGSCEIGMSSRELKDEELAAGLVPVTIALDGIAVIVHPENPVEDLTAEQIRRIYTGEITDWSEIG